MRRFGCEIERSLDVLSDKLRTITRHGIGAQIE
jgi:hypothetical protein